MRFYLCLYQVLFGLTAEDLNKTISIPLQSVNKHSLLPHFAVCNPERDPEYSALRNLKLFLNLDIQTLSTVPRQKFLAL